MILSYTVERKTGNVPSFTATRKVKSKESAEFHSRSLLRKSYRPDATVEYSNFWLETDDRKAICPIKLKSS